MWDRCSCPEAREAHRLYRKRLREDRLRDHGDVDGTGTRRRLRALARDGWPLRWQAQQVGVSDLSYLLSERSLRVRRRTAGAVRALYEATAGKLGPSRVAAGKAAAKGWHSSIAWDDATINDPAAKPNYGSRTNTYTDVDPVAVERRLHGDRTVRLTVAERREAVRVGSQMMRLYDWQIAERLDIELRSVQRLRTQLGLTPASTRAVA